MIALGIGLACLYLLYRALLPKPIPGIPFNKPSAGHLFRDLPAIKAHRTTADKGRFISYLIQTVEKLNAPLVQVLIKPLSKPLLVLGDFPEAYDILVRRGREFDQSPTFKKFLGGMGDRDHLFMKSDAVWKAQRRYVQDVIGPGFLSNVAAPVVYEDEMSNCGWKAVGCWRRHC